LSNVTEILRDVVAERGLLGSVWQYGGDAYADVADLVTPRTFGLESNRNIWSVVHHVFEQNPAARLDYPTFLSSARAIGLEREFDNDAEKEHLRSIINAGPLTQLANARSLAGRVAKLEVARNGHSILGRAQEQLLSVTGDEPIDQILAMVESPIYDFTASLAGDAESGPKEMGEGLTAYVDYLANNQRQNVGVPSPYAAYNDAIGGGFRPGTVSMIGARTKVGKSLLSINIGVWIAMQLGIPVLYLDTEMTREDQQTRILAMLSGVPIREIETGQFANFPAKKYAVEQAALKLQDHPYDFLSIAGQPFEETVAVMRRWVTKRVGLDENGKAKPCLIIFDYLKLMSSEAMSAKNLAEFQVLGFMMTQLHNFAVRWMVPLLSFIQLNRDGIDKEDTSTASGSDRIVWLCSNYSIYKAKSDDEMAEQTGNKEIFNRKLIPVVARHGGGLDSGDYINFMSHGSIARIVEGPTRDQLARGVGKSGKAEGMIVDGDTGDQDIPFAA
jgi:replicative DNA helicase